MRNGMFCFVLKKRNMRTWLFRETKNFAKRPVSFAKQRNSFRIEFRETKSETSFAGNPSPDSLSKSTDSTHGFLGRCDFKDSKNMK
jgi:hypothetical protein